MSRSWEGARATRNSTRQEETDSQKLEAEMDIFQQIAGCTGESLEAVCNMAEGERSHLVKVLGLDRGPHPSPLLEVEEVPPHDPEVGAEGRKRRREAEGEEKDVPKKRPSMQEEDAGVGAEVEEVAGVAPTGAGGDVAGGTPRKTGGRLSRSKNRNITEVKSSEVAGSSGTSTTPGSRNTPAPSSTSIHKNASSTDPPSDTTPSNHINDTSTGCDTFKVKKGIKGGQSSPELAEKFSEEAIAAGEDTTDEEAEDSPGDCEIEDVEADEVDVKEDDSTEPWEDQDKPDGCLAEDIKNPGESAKDIKNVDESDESTDASETLEAGVTAGDAAELQIMSNMQAIQRLLVTETTRRADPDSLFELRSTLDTLARSRLTRLSPGLALKQTTIPVFCPGVRESRPLQSPAVLLAGLRSLSQTLAGASSAGLAHTSARSGNWIQLTQKKPPSQTLKPRRNWLASASYEEENMEVKKDKGRGRGKGRGRISGRGKGRSSPVAGRPGRRAAAKSAAEKFVEEQEIEEYSSGDDFLTEEQDRRFEELMNLPAGSGPGSSGVKEQGLFKKYDSVVDDPDYIPGQEKQEGQGEEQEGEDFMSDVMAVVKRTGTSRTLPSGLIITPVRGQEDEEEVRIVKEVTSPMASHGTRETGTKLTCPLCSGTFRDLVMLETHAGDCDGTQRRRSARGMIGLDDLGNMGF